MRSNVLRLISFLAPAGEKTRKTQPNDTFLLFASKQMVSFYSRLQYQQGLLLMKMNECGIVSYFLVLHSKLICGCGFSGAFFGDVLFQAIFQVVRVRSSKAVKGVRSLSNRQQAT